MIDVRKLFRTEKNLVTGGIWYEIKLNETDICGFKLAYMNQNINPNYAAVNERIMRQFRTLKLGPGVSKEMLNEPTLRVFSEAICVDWRNVYNENGELIPYSSENAFAYFRDCPELVDHLESVALSPAHYKLEIGDAESDAKNSSKS